MDLELRELTRAFHASPGDHDLRERYLRLQRRVGAHPHYAVLSCVHANLEAFEAVLRHAQSAGIETLICLGDLVGLGPDPTLVIDRARQRCSICLRGDHDQALIDGPDSDIEANPELRWLRELLKPRLISSPETRRRWRWLKELPLTHRHAGAMFVHASPRDWQHEYLSLSDLSFGETIKTREVFARATDLVFVGHSHIAGVLRSDMTAHQARGLQNTYTLGSRPGVKEIILTGSVGQPLDGDPRACYVEVLGAQLFFHRVDYDRASTKAKIKACPALNDDLAERLDSAG